MKYWNIYTTLVKRNCTSQGHIKDLAYWRDNLFAGTLIYLLPFCLIALLPALYLVFTTGEYIIAAIDLVTLFSMAVIAFVPGIPLTVRKIIYTSFVFSFSAAQLYYLGLLGPGLLYLLIACIFSILIFPTDYRFWPSWLNIFICFLVGVALSLDLLPWPRDKEHSLLVWTAVSTNLIFLSLLSSALIPQLFNGLQETIDKENELKLALNHKQQSLEHALSQLQQKNKELEQFAYVASHDLKEPLRMVNSFMGMLKNKYGGQLDEKAHTYIDFAIDGGKRMQQMIVDLLEFSRMGRQDGIKERIDMKDILKDVQQNILKLIEEHDAEIIVQTELPVLAVYRADFTRLMQNLLSNAIKFRKKETTPLIRVSAKEKTAAWLFSIEDNGIGIEKVNTEKVFDIFTRLHSHDTYEGTGIGLAVCKKIAERNGGEIWVESEEGKGSVFYFTIIKKDV